jgi:hypothetical protein
MEEFFYRGGVCGSDMAKSSSFNFDLTVDNGVTD